MNPKNLGPVPRSLGEGGFTLTEILIYLALFSLLCGGLISAVFGSIEASHQASKKVLERQEAEFVLKKLAWALLPATEISEPILGMSGQTLSINRFSEPHSISFNFMNDTVFIDEGFGLEQLNTSNIKIQDLFFEHYEDHGARFIKISFDVDNQSFESVKFFRSK